MSYAMDLKMQMLDEYIGRAEKIEQSKDVKLAIKLVDEVVGVYSAEIPHFTDGMSRYQWHLDGEKPDYLFDASLIKAKLLNHKANIRTGLYSKFFSDGSGNVTVNQSAQQSLENHISVSLDQTIEVIDNLPENSLTAEERVALIEKLASIHATKDKKSKWDKIKEVLKWVAEKGIEVGVAALPYIAKSLE